MLRFALAIVVPFVAISADAAAADARPGWYPRAGDLCAEYVARTSKPDLYGALLAPQLARDPVIAKFIADYNAASGSSDKGARAMSNLLKYCDTHASKKLGDVTAQEVMTDTAPAVTRTAQPAAADTSGLDAWYRQLVFYCGADNECKRLSKKAYDDAVACARGDAATCNEGGKNLLKLDPWLDAWLTSGIARSSQTVQRTMNASQSQRTRTTTASDAIVATPKPAATRAATNWRSRGGRKNAANSATSLPEWHGAFGPGIPVSTPARLGRSAFRMTWSSKWTRRETFATIREFCAAALQTKVRIQLQA